MRKAAINIYGLGKIYFISLWFSDWRLLKIYKHRCQGTPLPTN
jgi:hypothetical protein